eukprot:TRINITY_DN846_c0_g1_i1.p1 TRINITY_DN846_c0_g1~~TRINITY_DN846_c0_g1_i1.p1  ORF type:complete len:286 (-),score=69.28 TRINITY_DN846_c0_g1_i1:222-1079(-)
MATRNLSQAREAYGNINASIDAHRPILSETDEDNESEPESDRSVASEKHQKGGEFVKSMIFGGLDGIVTSFAVVASAAGARLQYAVVLIMGFSNLLADALAMGLGDFLSSKAELEYIKAEKAREAWEYDNYIEGEQREMVEIFESRGVDRNEAIQVIQILSKYKDLFIDLMLVSELGLMPPPEEDETMKDGMVTFCAFLVFGSVPLFSYLASLIWVDPHDEAGVDLVFGIAIALTAVSLFLLGSLKAKFTGQHWWKSGMLMIINGGSAAGLAYLVGFMLSEAFNL